MAKLIISEFADLQNRSLGGTGQVATGLLASHSITIGGASAQSIALQAGTTIVRVYAEADCNVAIGPNPNASTDPIVPLGPAMYDVLGATPGAGWKLAAITRVVA